MKRLLLLTLSISLLNFTSAQKNEWYSTSGWEIPFQFANVNSTTPGVHTSNIIRFAPVINLNFFENCDFSKRFGIFSGFTLRNVGFIADFKGDEPIYFSSKEMRKKFRTYNIGVPIGIKLGNLKGLFFYGGFHIEYAFNYKEKTFVDGRRQERFTVWFGDHAEKFPMSLIAGIQTKHGLNLKFQYYLNNFHNKDFFDSVNGIKPYSGFDANVFYVSLNFAVFKNTELYYKEYDND